MKRTNSIVWLVVLSTAVLASCGGGGGGGAIPSSPSGSTTTYTVTYDGNGSTGGTAPVDSNTYLQGQTVTVLGNTGNLVNTNGTGFSFSGWNTQANGSGTTYTQGQTCSMYTANVTLYAIWTAIPTYTVTYNGNGSTGGAVPIDTTHYPQGQTVTVLGNTGNLVKAPGYHFTGWSPSATGAYPSPTYFPGQTFMMGSSNVILYAQWSCMYKSSGETELDGCNIQFSTGNPGWCPGITTSDSNCWLCINSGNNYDLSVLRYDNSTSRVDITDWSANTPSSDKIWYWTFQSDGNLVVYCYNSSNQAYPCWASNTSGHPGAALVLYENYPLSATQRGCGFIIYDANGTQLFLTP